LVNFTDNPIEWFSQYQVRFAPGHLKYLPKEIESLRARILEAETKLKTLQQEAKSMFNYREGLKKIKQELELSLRPSRNIHRRITRSSLRERRHFMKKHFYDSKDPHYHELTTLKIQRRTVLIGR
jgi:phospholipase C